MEKRKYKSLKLSAVRFEKFHKLDVGLFYPLSWQIFTRIPPFSSVRHDTHLLPTMLCQPSLAIMSVETDFFFLINFYSSLIAICSSWTCPLLTSQHTSTSFCLFPKLYQRFSVKVNELSIHIPLLQSRAPSAALFHPLIPLLCCANSLSSFTIYTPVAAKFHRILLHLLSFCRAQVDCGFLWLSSPLCPLGTLGYGGSRKVWKAAVARLYQPVGPYSSSGAILFCSYFVPMVTFA